MFQEADLALSVINPTSAKKDVAVETETILPIELMIMAGRLSRHQSNILKIIQIFPRDVRPAGFETLTGQAHHSFEGHVYRVAPV